MGAISPDLAAAARNLEERFKLLGVATRVVRTEEWDRLPAPVRARVPAWLPGLLATYRLVGGSLEYRDPQNPWVLVFSFFDPRELASLLEDGSLMRGLLDHGYFAFANESNGSVWITRIEGEPNSVYLLEHSDWDGGVPSRDNGLRPGVWRLEVLLLGMGIGDSSVTL